MRAGSGSHERCPRQGSRRLPAAPVIRTWSSISINLVISWKVRMIPANGIRIILEQRGGHPEHCHTAVLFYDLSVETERMRFQRIGMAEDPLDAVTEYLLPAAFDLVKRVSGDLFRRGVPRGDVALQVHGDNPASHAPQDVVLQDPEVFEINAFFAEFLTGFPETLGKIAAQETQRCRTKEY